MKVLLLALVVVLTGCSSPAEPAPPPQAQQLDAEGSPLRTLPETGPGPQGEDPDCSAFLPGGTCTRVGDVVWVLQADGGSWQLTAYDRDEERERWVPALQGSGGGLNPTVTEVDLSEAEQPETLVVYGGGFDLVSSRQAERPRVVVHGEGQASVQDGRVRAGEREVQRVGERWVSVPAR